MSPARIRTATKYFDDVGAKHPFIIITNRPPVSRVDFPRCLPFGCAKHAGPNDIRRADKTFRLSVRTVQGERGEKKKKRFSFIKYRAVQQRQFEFADAEINPDYSDEKDVPFRRYTFIVRNLVSGIYYQSW